MNARLTLAAEADVREINVWYLEQGEGLSQAFKNALDLCLARVEANPLASQQVHGSVRRALLRRFPYCVYYLATGTEIVVIGVFHGHRDPLVWRRRHDA